jgi:hypothetical protein
MQAPLHPGPNILLTRLLKLPCLFYAGRRRDLQGRAVAKRRLSSATDHVGAAFVLPYCCSSAAGAAFDKPQRG